MEIRHIPTDDKTKLAFVYQPHMLVFAGLLLVAAVMGIINKKNIEQAFSYMRWYRDHVDCKLGPYLLMLRWR